MWSLAVQAWRALVVLALIAVVAAIYAGSAYSPLPRFNRELTAALVYVDSDDEPWVVEWAPEREKVLGVGYWTVYREGTKPPRLPTMTVFDRKSLRATWAGLTVYMDECP